VEHWASLRVRRATTAQKGDALEKRVIRLLKRLGKMNIKSNVIIKDAFGNISEIDVMYGIFSKTYIECKNYSAPVPLKDVAKFKEVLALNGIPLERGLFVTTSTFVPRAETIGVRLVNGKQLRAWERRSYVYALIKQLLKLALIAGGAVLIYEAATDPTNFNKHIQTAKLYTDQLVKEINQLWKKWS
jgi:restriction endonuclease Mrr